MAYVKQSADRLSDAQDTTLLDPTILVAARKIYLSYCKTHPESPRRPAGAVIGGGGDRGQLVFKDKPVLLFRERFVPFEQIEADPSVE